MRKLILIDGWIRVYVSNRDQVHLFMHIFPEFIMVKIGNSGDGDKLDYKADIYG